jgi:hypothetical protein
MVRSKSSVTVSALCRSLLAFPTQYCKVWNSLWQKRYNIVQCMVFGHWRSERGWRSGLLGVVKWRGVGVYSLGTTLWRDQVYLRRWREELGTNMTLSLRELLAPSLPFENSTGQKPCTALYIGRKVMTMLFVLMMQIQAVAFHHSGLHLLHLMLCLLYLYSQFFM